MTEEEAQAGAILAEVALASHRFSEARTQADVAASLVAKSQNRELHFRIDTVAARVRAASGTKPEIEQATKLLESIEAEATRNGFLEAQLEARLALAETELRSGDAAAARASSVEKTARDKGFLLVARHAANLQASH